MFKIITIKMIKKKGILTHSNECIFDKINIVTDISWSFSIEARAIISVF